MSLLNNIRKQELKLIAEELGETVPAEAKIIEIKSLIECSDIYQTNPEFVRGVIKLIVEDQKNKAAAKQTELELSKLKLAQLEKEIELQKLKLQSPQEILNHNVSTNSESSPSLESLIRSVKTLTIPVPERPEALHLFFQSLEKSFHSRDVPVEMRSEILINLLGEKGSNVLTYASEQEIADYDKLKVLILKEFQPTPRECLGNFKGALRYSNESHIQFAARLSASFDYYCRLREVNDFKKLCDLMVSDKLYETLDFKTREHIGIREGQNWFRPNELGRECDLYYSSRGKSLADVNLRKECAENKKSNFKRNYPQKIQSYPMDSFNGHANQSYKSERICYICGAKNEEFHYARNCPKRFENKHITNTVSGPKITADSLTRNKLEYIDLLIDGKKIKCLKDSGSELIIIKKSLFPNKPSKGLLQINSCFGNVIDAEIARFSFSADGRKWVELEATMCTELFVDCIFPPCCLNLLASVVDDPTSKEQVSNSSAGDFFSFLSAAVEGDEIDLQHLTRGELRNSVSRLIKNYVPEKQPRSTDIKMNIILKDEIPVSQRSRRIPFAEQKIVDKQIDEWLKDGIIKPSCSDYASPIVLCKKKDGTSRLCVDFKQLNKKVIKDSFPMANVEEEETNVLMQEREDIREEARKGILRIQEENRRTYNRKRKKARLYNINDLVAIQRTQFGSGLKLKPKFFGPYQVISQSGKDRYQVEKIGQHEGPGYTSTAADHMKPWSTSS